MSRDYLIAVLPGDGHGPAVIAAAQAVLSAAGERFGFRVRFQPFPYSGAHYLQSGELMPDSALEALKHCRAILYGGVGHREVPPGLLSREILLRITDALDLYISLRPVHLMPGVKSYLRAKDPGAVNYLIVREYSGGLSGKNSGRVLHQSDREVASETAITSRYQVDRCLRYAFECAGSPERRGRLTLSGKSSLMPCSYDLWTRAFSALGDREFPAIRREYVEADDLCMQLVRSPGTFDVIVTENLLGDLLANVGAVSQGGAGYACIGSLHPGGIGMFGPMRASPEFYAGAGLQANPIAAVNAAALLLRHLGESEAARRLEEAVLLTTATEVMGEGTILGRFQTREVTEMILHRLL